MSLDDFVGTIKRRFVIGRLASIVSTSLTAERTYTLPDKDGTFAMMDDVGGSADHGALTGLADDDHPQYLTEARGDARYTLIGADAWTYAKLGVDFTTTSATAVDVTGIAFTHVANGIYEFEARLMVRTATATVGPSPGIAWPTGLLDGAVDIEVTTSASAIVRQLGGTGAAVLAPVGGLPTTTQSYPAHVRGMLFAGASPSGSLKLQLASETAGKTVTIKKGSFLKWRKLN